ncbi:10807_t:CDS:2, partial [Acaulospora morrowiae]
SKSPNDDEIFRAEMRLHSIWFGVVLTPLAFPLFGWSLLEKWPFSIPIGAMYLGGFAVHWVLIVNSTYLIDTNPTKSSSAIALKNLTSFLLGGIIIGFASPIYKLINIGLLFTLASGVNVLCTSLLVIVIFKGEKWREERGEDK